MNQLNRRNWLRTAGLSTGMLMLGNTSAFALNQSEELFFNDELIMLNANENAFSPSFRIQNAISENFDLVCRYPFRIQDELIDAIAAKEGVPRSYVVITGGSTEGLKAAGLIYGRDGGEIIAADPTYQSLLSYAENHGAKIHRVPLNDAMEHDLDAMANRINEKTRLIFICNPNNPSGTIIDANDMIDFCKSYDHKAVIFSDEAYYDYITEPDYPSMIALVKEGRNIIVSKTFSKVYGLAGLRVGYLIAKPVIAMQLKKSVMANTNVLAIKAAQEALKDDDFYKYSIAKNMEAKLFLYKTLDELGLRYVPSHANFVFFESGRPISQLQAQMKAEQILIGRPFPPLDKWARISTGKMEHMKQFTVALKKVLS
ncbi:histidinol-phosphate transaminase [Lutimonas halocynthiae]|uniref:pyridoxal phosphate-dependent aminotransferase n=1 Tax=Lutimonas halocynthiae TaxID=1446477 RepID=UPI0025B28933|nr:histidinol-phosphate transaminase [Lutimonas halocynthiae]MDN3643925.1 histidinol-phosphate transaminase [Lutimonas halocynthiae]